MPGLHTHIRLIAIVPIALALACNGDGVTPPPPVDITGTWTGEVTVQNSAGTEHVQAMLQLSQNGKDVAGTYTGSNGRTGNVAGSLSGKRFTVTTTFTDICPGSTSSVGDLSDDETRMTGNYTGNDCTGSFNGTFTFDKQTGTVAQVTVTPASATIAVGSTVQLSAMAKDRAGNSLPGRPVAWSSSDDGIATVSTGGLVTGLSAGSVTVTATSGLVTGAASITVSESVGDLRVTVSTVGQELDPDGYQISVDDGTGRSIAISGTITFAGLTPGSHSVRLTGQANNCVLGGDNPLVVTVSAGATVEVRFDITCTTSVGSIQVTVVTTGASPDPDGYTVSVDNGNGQAIGVNGSLLIPNLAAGHHTVQLSGLAPNCTVGGPNPRGVEVTAGTTTASAFEVSCRTPSGTIEVTTTTVGGAFDPDGFAVALDDRPADPVGTDAIVRYSEVTPGEHHLTLSGLTILCRVIGENPRAANVAGGVTTSLTFQVRCEIPQTCAHTGIAPPPLYQTYKPLMPRVAPAGPVFVTGSELVPTCGLTEAGYMLGVMLEHREDVAVALREQGTLTAVFARSEAACDLPYFSDLQGQPPCDNSAGGLGGVPGREATACSEKNVMKESDDPYGRGSRSDGENVCVHELGHTIMNVGLSDSDRDAIRQRFEAVVVEGLWHDAPEPGDPTQHTAATYALTNADEFWAEVTQSYFCANPAVPSFLHNGVNCADQLQAYDPSTYELVNHIYGGASDLR